MMEDQDQVIQSFHLKVTPLEVEQNKKIYKSKKSIVIKLANKQSKSKTLNDPIHLNIPVLYSRTLNRYCPVKGIIKIYDVNEDGSQMICSVGAFQTDQLLNEGFNEKIISRDIGPCKLKMKIQYRLIQNNQVKSEQYLVKPSLQNNEKFGEKKINKEQPFDQLEVKSKLKDETSDRDFSFEVKKNQIEVLGQQLILERRGNKVLQEKLEKHKLKSNLWKKKLGFCEQQIRQYLKIMKKFVQFIDIHEKSQLKILIQNQMLQIPVKNGQNREQTAKQIKECLNFMKLKINNPVISDKENDINNSNFLDRGDIQNQQGRLQEQNKKLQNQLQNYELNFRNKCNQLHMKGIELHSKERQIHELEKKLEKKNQQYKNLEALSQYLKEKDTQMENLLATKQNTIENLRSMITEANIEVQRLEHKDQNQEKLVNNLELIIEQMKEQISNLSETIETYRIKFGDLKAAKDKALERQLKDCLRWIDQQNRDVELTLEDTVEPVTSFIKSSFEEIEHMPLEEISVIRKQIVNILKKVDDLVAKNSI